MTGLSKRYDWELRSKSSRFRHIVPVAAFGKINPIFAAAAMALSSVTVVSNSLRLQGIRQATGAAMSVFGAIA
jgi:hypothetical protein